MLLDLAQGLRGKTNHAALQIGWLSAVRLISLPCYPNSSNPRPHPGIGHLTPRASSLRRHSYAKGDKQRNWWIKSPFHAILVGFQEDQSQRTPER